MVKRYPRLPVRGVDLMKSFAGLPIIVLALLVWLPTLGAGQDQPAKPSEPSGPFKEVTGTIASVDEKCSSFVLVQQPESSKTEITFTPWQRVPWIHDLGGCAIVSPNESRLVLKPGTRI